MLTSSSSRFILRALLLSLPRLFPCCPLIIIFPPLYFPLLSKKIKDRQGNSEQSSKANVFFSLLCWKLASFLSLSLFFVVCPPLWLEGWWGGRQRQGQLLWSLAPGSQLFSLCLCLLHTHRHTHTCSTCAATRLPLHAETPVDWAYQQQATGDISIWTVSCWGRAPPHDTTTPTSGPGDVQHLFGGIRIQRSTVLFVCWRVLNQFMRRQWVVVWIRIE